MKKEKISVKIEPSGWFFFVTVSLLGVLSISLKNSSLFLLYSFLLGLFVTSSILSHLGMKHISLEIKFPKEMYRRTPAYLTFTLSNSLSLPIFGVGISLFAGDEKIIANFPLLRGKEKRKKAIKVSFENRGNKKLSKVEISSDFPIGIVTRKKVISLQEEFIVFPNLRRGEALFFEKRGCDIEGTLNIGAGDFRELRGYRPGDSPKRIYWKGLARTGQVLVKEFEEEEKRIVIDLSNWKNEAQIEIASYIAVKAIKDGYAVGLVTKERMLPPLRGDFQRRRILKELALL